MCIVRNKTLCVFTGSVDNDFKLFHILCKSDSIVHLRKAATAASAARVCASVCSARLVLTLSRLLFQCCALHLLLIGLPLQARPDICNGVHAPGNANVDVRRVLVDGKIYLIVFALRLVAVVQYQCCRLCADSQIEAGVWWCAYRRLREFRVLNWEMDKK